MHNFHGLSRVWLSLGSYGSTWLLRDVGGYYGVYLLLFIYKTALRDRFTCRCDHCISQENSNVKMAMKCPSLRATFL